MQAAVVEAVYGNYEAALAARDVHPAERTANSATTSAAATLVRIFALLPKGSDLAKSYRRRMFALMH